MINFKRFSFCSLRWGFLPTVEFSLSCFTSLPSLDLGLRVLFFLSFFCVLSSMADDVAAELGNMKLTFDEEEIIPISDEGRVQAMESCSLSLIGKFLTCKPFNKCEAKTTLRKAWGLENSLQIIEVGPNLFQFKFETEFDIACILQDGPWSFDNQLYGRRG